MTVRLVSPPRRAREQVGQTLSVGIVHAEAARTIVALRGEGDRSTTAVLSDALSRVIASRAGDVVIDLAQLEFIDTATVRVLATAHHLLASQGRTLLIRSPSRLGRRVLELFALTDVIETAALPAA